MKTSYASVLLIVLLSQLIFTGDTLVDGTSVLAPFPADSVSYETGRLFILSVARESGDDLLVSTQWEVYTQVDLSTKALKEEFPKTFVMLLPPSSTLQSVTFVQRYFRGYSVPESLAYAYPDTVRLASLWVDPTFVGMVKQLQGVDVLSVIIAMKGWKDTTLTPVYDDPVADNRSLYKFPVQLIPGVNEIHFAPGGVREKATTFTTRYDHGSVPPAERASRFHNSELEQGCTTCHEGLPSADGGATMTADCSTCHKEHSLADYIHGPVEMKECATCHSWSAEKKAVVVEAGIPATCEPCHADKLAAIDSAAAPHAVASECMTCHSAHSSDRKHLLKDDTNKLCAGCHEGFELNHPVGRHPVRFKTVAATGEEISCASCHNPHGGTHPKLLMASNKAAEICAQCH